MSYRYDKGCVNYAREKVVTLVNRRIDEMLDGHKRNYVNKKSYIVSPLYVPNKNIMFIVKNYR